MFPFLRNYWLVCLLYIAAIAFTISQYITHIYGQKTFWLLSGLEVVSFVVFVLQTKRKIKTINHVIIESGETVTVKGVFKKLSLRKTDIIKIEMSKNLLSNIFDWSYVSVYTKNNKYNLYTPHTIL